MARLNLVEALGAIGRPALPPLLVGLTACPNPVVRRSCGKALAKLGDARSVEPLIAAMLADPDAVTRASAAGALARVGVPAAAALLGVLARDEDVDTGGGGAGAAAAGVLAARPPAGGTPADVAAAAAAAAAGGMTAKGHAAWALSFMGPAAGEVLLDAAGGGYGGGDDVRCAAVAALGGIAAGDVLPAMAGGGDGAAAAAAAAAADVEWADVADKVGGGGAPPPPPPSGDGCDRLRARAVASLLAALTGDGAPRVRIEAGTGLANAGIVAAAPALVGRLARRVADGPSPDADGEAGGAAGEAAEERRAAALSLMKLRYTPAVPALEALVADGGEAPTVVAVARLALTMLGRMVEAERAEEEWA